MIAIRPEYFRRLTEAGYQHKLVVKHFGENRHSVGFNQTHWDWQGRQLPFSALEQACALKSLVRLNGQHATSCTDLKIDGDGSSNKAIFITHFSVPSNMTGDTLSVAIDDGTDGGWQVTLSPKHRLNAMQNYQFVRPETSLITDSKPNMKIAVCVKPVTDFNPFVRDLVQYYEKEGFSHVYIGLHTTVNANTVQQYWAVLAPWIEKQFVSLGWHEPPTMLWLACPSKMPFINSVLYHSKSYDTGLMVVDLDEVLVAMAPESCMAPDALLRVALPTPIDKTCYAVLQSNTLPIAVNPDASTLAEKFPVRCEGGMGDHVKSLAIVKNVDCVGLHLHGNCKVGTSEVNANASVSTIHHYTSLWHDRWKDPGCNIGSEFARAKKIHLLGLSQANRSMSCGVGVDLYLKEDDDSMDTTTSAKTSSTKAVPMGSEAHVGSDALPLHANCLHQIAVMNELSEPGSPGCNTFELHTEYVQENLSTIAGVADEMRCAELCGATKHCEHFTYIKSDSQCLLNGAHTLANTRKRLRKHPPQN